MKLSRRISLILLIPLCACTTLSSRIQRVKVASNPEGAEIVYEGHVLGKTPGFINLPRHHHGQLTIEKRGYKPTTLDLATSYRWGDSFAANFVWLFYGEPVASVIDLLNETAWSYDKIPVVDLLGKRNSPTRLATDQINIPRVIAIAPPQSNYELLSDELGKKLQDSAGRRYPSSQILPFDKTEQEFNEYSYNDKEKTDEANRDNLYDELGVTHILESTTQPLDDGILVHATLTDVFTDKQTPAFDEKFFSQSLDNYNSGTFKHVLVSLLSVVPNLFTFDFDTPSSNMNINSGPASSVAYTGVSNRSDTVLEFLSSLGVRSVRSPKLSEGFQGVFRFVPVVSLNYDRFTFQAPGGQTNALQGYSFDWYTFNAGVGPEAGLDTSIGYFYLDLAPCYSVNWITGSGNGTDSSSRTSNFTFLAEFGYQIFLSQRLNMRIFARTVSIPSNTFGNIISDLTGQSDTVDSATRSLAGLSLGYYFSEVRPFVKHLLF